MNHNLWRHGFYVRWRGKLRDFCGWKSCLPCPRQIHVRKKSKGRNLPCGCHIRILHQIHHQILVVKRVRCKLLVKHQILRPRRARGADGGGGRGLGGVGGGAGDLGGDILAENAGQGGYGRRRGRGAGRGHGGVGSWAGLFLKTIFLKTILLKKIFLKKFF